MRLEPSSLSRRGFLTGFGALVLDGPAFAEPTVAPAPLPRVSPPTTTAQALDAAVRWARSTGARLGGCFIDLASGAELAAASADVAENPASNQKLVTAGALLRNLGPERTFATGLYGRVVSGRVETLVLRGEGDPSLTSADLAAMAAALKERGVREVGALLVDQSAFDDHFVPPGFEQQPNEWAAFRAPVSAVAVDRNSVLVTIEPAQRGSPARVSFLPDGFVESDGQIATGARGKPLRAVAGLAPRGDHLVAHLGGAVAEGSAPLRYRQRVEDPRLLPAYVLRTALAAVGVKADGRLLLGGSGERNELLVHRSRRLAELLPELGKNSDNFYAETLLKALGAAIVGTPGTSAQGAEVASTWLKEIGAWDAGTRVTNGSGLFDTNRLSPRTLARLLAHGWRDPALGPDFVAQLAVGGVDGTLKERFSGLAARRAVLAKTGTLKDIVALSGYAVGPDRRRAVAFSMIASNLHGRLTAARQRIDAVVEGVVRDLWGDAPAAAG
jgi:D-alanyl-D-alanine carboxypeptidase/D-alanyl-D-alanine-endopeptidase (penicillin-binding protein 4)